MAEARKMAGREVSIEFKRAVVMLAVSFAFYRLLFSLFAPDAWHIPDEVLLGIMVCLVAYLWMAEVRTLSHLSRSESALRSAQVGTLAALVEAVEAKDPYTRGHSEQVRRLSVALAQKMGLEEDRIGIVSRAAVLHDVGKLETPDAILHKTEPLTDADWQTLKKHPERTATILSSLGFLAPELRVAMFHHERCDGTGYGAGLKGSDIPLEASIIAVADMFDAMHSDRPYRPKVPRERILEEFQQSRDVQHPAAVIDPFLEMLGERPELWLRMRAPGSDHA